MARYAQPGEITVGVVGYGGAFNMGKEHLDRMQAVGMTPAAVVELDATRLEAARKDFPGIETYANVDAMLAGSRVQLVVIITPHNTHADIALRCIRAGKHVICEKPFAITTSACDEMIAAAAERDLFLSAYHNRHWDGHMLKAVELVRDQRAIGDIIRIEAHMGWHSRPADWWRSSKSISGGVMYDWGVHLLEYGLQLIDGEITEVTGVAKHGFWGPQTRWNEDANEDEAFALVRFKDGRWMTLCITQIDANPKRGMLEVTGTDGSYIMDFAGWEMHRPQADGSMLIAKGKNPDSQQHLYYRNVADHLVSGAPLIITPEWARRPIHILDLAGQSARLGRAMPARHR